MRRRRARDGRRRRGARVVAACSVLLAVSSSGWALTRSSVFAITGIHVVGVRSAPAGRVIAASGLRLGQPALALDLDAAAARVRRLPFIEDARVERAGPLGVRIVVLERAPVAEVRSAEGRWLVDRRGGFFEATERSSAALPVIVLRAGRRALADQGFSLTAAIGDVLALWERAPHDVRERIRWFEPRAGGLVLDLAGVLVVFGSTDRIDDKFVALSLVEQRVARDRRTLRRVDVTAPDRPAALIR